jgi:hypothetical protein
MEDETRTPPSDFDVLESDDAVVSDMDRMTK